MTKLTKKEIKELEKEVVSLSKRIRLYEIRTIEAREELKFAIDALADEQYPYII
jgi:hypothetical protein